MVLRHLLSILILPTTVTVVVPYFIVSSRSSNRMEPTTLAIGLMLMAAGLSLVVMTVRFFVTIGKGTLAPWDPTRRLVVTGVYRYVRNPMISGVLMILFGEAIALRSPGVLRWATGFLVLNALYIPLIEEQGLVRRFGEQYVEYRRNVPRWIPRLTPWKQT